MHEHAIFEAVNGERIEGLIADDHPECRDHEVLFVVAGRARRAPDLPPGRLFITVPQRTLRAAALVQRALRAGFVAVLDLPAVAAPLRARRRVAWR